MYRYRWLLNNGLGLTEICPIYGSDAEVVLSQATKEKYYTSTVPKSITLVREDYQKVKDGDFDYNFEIFLQRDSGALNAFETWYQLTFNKTDCTFDDQNKNVIVKLEVDDATRKVVAKLSEEFNMLDLVNGATKVDYKKKGLVQVYTTGSSVITNVLGTTFWETEVLPENNPVVLETDYFFSQPDSLFGNRIHVAGTDTAVTGTYNSDYEKVATSIHFETFGYANDTNGGGPSRAQDDPNPSTNLRRFRASNPLLDYSGVFTDDDFGSTWRINGTTDDYVFVGKQPDDLDMWYYFKGLSANAPGTSGTLNHISGATNTADFPANFEDSDLDYIIRWALYDGTTLLYLSNEIFYSGIPQYYTANALVFDEVGGTDKIGVTVVEIRARLLTDLNEIGGVATDELADDDITSEIGYRYATSFDITNLTVQSTHETTKTSWGKIPENAANWGGEYFSYPFIVTQPFIPIAQSDWKDASVWFLMTTTLTDEAALGDTGAVVKDTYPFWVVLREILNEIDSSVSFSNTTDYSEFLFAEDNPVTSEENRTLLMTPKSNILVSQYDAPDSEEIITLKDLLEFLRIAFKAYWFIDSTNKFRIEHVSWFENGGDYDTEVIGFDLTELLEPKTKRSWEYGNGIYSYEKSEMPEKIRFNWMDTVSEPFKGYDIKAISNYVQFGLTEEMNISKVTTDVEYLLANSGQVSRNGFVILSAKEMGSMYTLPSEVLDVGERIFTVQNGQLSMIYLHENFHKHGLPAEDVTLNEEDITALSVERNKIQNVEFPQSETIDPFKLLTTSIGNGVVSQISINLDTNIIKAKMRHDTQ